jgi:hypothetical protein
MLSPDSPPRLPERHARLAGTNPKRTCVVDPSGGNLGVRLRTFIAKT